MLQRLTLLLSAYAPPPLLLVVVQRAVAAVAYALPLVALDAATTGAAFRVFSNLNDWLSAATGALIVLLAARVAAAVHRWRLGQSDLVELTTTARSVLTLTCSFVVATDESVAPFIADLKRFLLAYVALALHACRQDVDDAMPVESLRLLLDETREMPEMWRCQRNKTRVAVIELWLRTRISRAGLITSDTPDPPLHTAHVIELQHVVSTLPLLYDNAMRAWSQPPQWQFLTVHIPRVVHVYLAFYTVVNVTSSTYGLVLVGVFGWALVLCGLDAFASVTESRPFQHTDEATDPLGHILLDLQDEIDAVAHAFFRSTGGRTSWERWNRSVTRQPQRPPVSIPRSTSSIAPASPRRSPRSPITDGTDALGKPSLKHILDLITTAPSPSVSTTAAEAGSASERQPLLPPTPRYDLFLRLDDELNSAGESEETTENDEEIVQQDDRDPPV